MTETYVAVKHIYGKNPYKIFWFINPKRHEITIGQHVLCDAKGRPERGIVAGICQCRKDEADMTIGVEPTKSIIGTGISAYTDHIYVPAEWKQTPPKEEKINTAVRQYDKLGRFEPPIIVRKAGESNNYFILEDGYTSLLAAKILDIEIIGCYMRYD